MDDETQKYIFLLLAIASILLLPVYIRWGNRRIEKKRKLNNNRFSEFEKRLVKEINDYTCFTNSHPYVWGEIGYLESKNQILESVKWEAGSQGSFLYTPTSGYDYSLKIDETQGYLYIAFGSDSFDWDSLCHYEKWKKREVVYYGKPPFFKWRGE